MNILKSFILVVAANCCLAGCPVLFAQDSKAESPKSFQWQTASPESQGMSTEKLDTLRDKLIKMRTTALLVVRNDKIVYEYYAKEVDAHKPLGTASLAKAIVGGLSLAVVMTDGKMSLDDPAMKFVPAWKSEPLKSKITIRNLGSHTSGISDASAPGVKHEDLTSWMGDFWKKLDPPNDPFTLARDKAPMLFAPGEKIKYSNPAIAMLTYCVTAAIQGGPHRDIRTMLRDRVMRPMGVPDNEWTCGYGQVFTVDSLPIVAAWGGGSYSLDAQARIGRLVLRQGEWEGKQLLSPEAVQMMTNDAGLPGHCGMGWWTNGGRYPELPQDAVWGAGAGDKVLLVVPSLKLIVARSGQGLLTPEEVQSLNPKDVHEEFHDPREKVFFRPLMKTIIQTQVNCD